MWTRRFFPGRFFARRYWPMPVFVIGPPSGIGCIHFEQESLSVARIADEGIC